MMPKGLKTALIILGVLVLLGGGCVAAIALWIKSNLPEIEEMGNVATAEGEQLGPTTDARGCVAEALGRGDACDGIVCEAGAGIFLRSCLEHTQVPLDFCDGVPPTDSIMDSVRWRLAVCAEAGTQDDQRCGRIVNAVQEYCHAAPASGSD